MYITTLHTYNVYTIPTANVIIRTYMYVYNVINIEFKPPWLHHHWSCMQAVVKMIIYIQSCTYSQSRWVLRTYNNYINKGNQCFHSSESPSQKMSSHSIFWILLIVEDPLDSKLLWQCILGWIFSIILQHFHSQDVFSQHSSKIHK